MKNPAADLDFDAALVAFAASTRRSLDLIEAAERIVANRRPTAELLRAGAERLEAYCNGTRDPRDLDLVEQLRSRALCAPGAVASGAGD